MLHQDYLMRTIQALTQAFLNLIGASDTSPAQLRHQLDGTLADHFATQPELLPGLPIDRVEDEPVEVCGELGRLFALQAELSRKLNDPMREGISTRWGLRSFTRGFSATEVPKKLEEAAFDFLRSPSADDHAHPHDVRACYLALLRSAMRARRLEHAEDALFAAADLNASVDQLADGSAYFRDVLGWEDQAIEAAGMSREEVESILDDLNA